MLRYKLTPLAMAVAICFTAGSALAQTITEGQIYNDDRTFNDAVVFNITTPATDDKHEANTVGVLGEKQLSFKGDVSLNVGENVGIALRTNDRFTVGEKNNPVNLFEIKTLEEKPVTADWFYGYAAMGGAHFAPFVKLGCKKIKNILAGKSLAITIKNNDLSRRRW